MTAVSTDLATVTRVAGRFALAAPPTSVVPFGQGHINETFLVSTGRHEYLLQRINRDVFSEPDSLIENIVVLSNHLSRRFMRDLVPELVPANSGDWLVHDDDHVWRAWNRVPGAAPIAQPAAGGVAAAAHLLGRFHAGVADLDPTLVHETLPRFHDPKRRIAHLRDVVDSDPLGRVEGVRSEIAVALAAAPLAELADDLVARVPTRVAHNDAKLDNVLFRRDDAMCLVDLDTVMPTAWFWDVGDLLRTASTRVAEDDSRVDLAAVDPVLYQAVLDGYRAGVSITNLHLAEIEAIEHAGAIVTYEQALRFLTDWIAGDVYYRIAHPGHNLDRARNQLALLGSMPGTVGS